MTRAEQVRERRELLVNLIQDYWEEHGQGPTRLELAELADLSVETVSRHLQVLLRERVLAENYSGDRSLRLAD